MFTLEKLFKWMRRVFDSGPPYSPPEDDEPEKSPDEPEKSPDDDFEVVWPPYVEWPERPDDPDNVMEVKLYYPEEDPHVKRMCRQAVPYVEYCFLEAWGQKYNYDIDVRVHEDGVPEEHTGNESFGDWYWQLDDMAKDANILLVDRGGERGGSAGGYGGWVDVTPWMTDFDFDPEQDQIKNVGKKDGHEGAARVVHETGHCFGLGHDGGYVEKWGQRALAPMRVSYDSGHRFSFELHPVNRKQRPKVQPMSESKWRN